MTPEEVRVFALSLPESTEEPHFEMSSFRVVGKIFAAAPPGGEYLHIFLDEYSARASVQEDPVVFEELWWGKKLCGIRVALAAADPSLVEELLEEAWRRKAPRRAVAAWESRQS